MGVPRVRLGMFVFAEMPSLAGPKGEGVLGQARSALGVLGTLCPQATAKGLCDGGDWPEQTVDALVGKAQRTNDFYHATEHLADAAEAAFSEDEHVRKEWYQQQRTLLLLEDKGAECVVEAIDALATAANDNERKKTLEREANYFRKRVDNMRYAKQLDECDPIGSGEVETQIKQLSTQRMKRVGACWTEQGGQAVLNLRALHISDLEDRAWELHRRNEQENLPKAA